MSKYTYLRSDERSLGFRKLPRTSYFQHFCYFACSPRFICINNHFEDIEGCRHLCFSYAYSNLILIPHELECKLAFLSRAPTTTCHFRIAFFAKLNYFDRALSTSRCFLPKFNWSAFVQSFSINLQDHWEKKILFKGPRLIITYICLGAKFQVLLSNANAIASRLNYVILGIVTCNRVVNSRKSNYVDCSDSESHLKR